MLRQAWILNITAVSGFKATVQRCPTSARVAAGMHPKSLKRNTPGSAYLLRQAILRSIFQAYDLVRHAKQRHPPLILRRVHDGQTLVPYAITRMLFPGAGLWMSVSVSVSVEASRCWQRRSSQAQQSCYYLHYVRQVPTLVAGRRYMSLPCGLVIVRMDSSGLCASCSLDADVPDADVRDANVGVDERGVCLEGREREELAKLRISTGDF
ncbi:hypothetical protein K504DRAFT_449374 [Pleomassaria siparia CBS 279.74]|uniref:Uncharacterized protein n=1 Tax=Pleomassaria siparia CBS 279.74 TaxID=1314801 RepID=A0A6G1JW90_9PLEO|nr:hypothetical protein K504DRAFT_449374 [Pleomassaria siparia CBS 279.74]